MTGARIVLELLKDRHCAAVVFGSPLFRKNPLLMMCPIRGCAMTVPNEYALKGVLKNHFSRARGEHKKKSDAAMCEVITQRLSFYYAHENSLSLTQADVDAATSTTFRAQIQASARNVYVPSKGCMAKVLENAPYLAGSLALIGMCPLEEDEPDDPLESQRAAVTAREKLDAELRELELLRKGEQADTLRRVKALEDAANLAKDQEIKKTALSLRRLEATNKIESVVDVKMEGNNLLFSVKWKDLEETTWESSELIGASAVYAEFVKARASGLRAAGMDGDPITDPDLASRQLLLNALNNASNGLMGTIVQSVKEVSFAAAGVVLIDGVRMRATQCGSQVKDGVKDGQPSPITHTNMCVYLSVTAKLSSKQSG
jgi:hypothetical protein